MTGIILTTIAIARSVQMYATIFAKYLLCFCRGPTGSPLLTMTNPQHPPPYPNGT